MSRTTWRWLLRLVGAQMMRMLRLEFHPDFMNILDGLKQWIYQSVNPISSSGCQFGTPCLLPFILDMVFTLNLRMWRGIVLKHITGPSLYSFFFFWYYLPWRADPCFGQPSNSIISVDNSCFLLRLCISYSSEEI